MSHCPRIYIRGRSETIPAHDSGFSLIFRRIVVFGFPLKSKPAEIAAGLLNQ